MKKGTLKIGGRRLSILEELKLGKGTRSKELLEQRLFGATGDDEASQKARENCMGWMYGLIRRGFVERTENGSFRITDAGKAAASASKAAKVAEKPVEKTE